MHYAAFPAPRPARTHVSMGACYNRRGATGRQRLEEGSVLSIYFGEMPDAIYNTSTYFKNTYLDSWFEDDFARRMIKSVDKSRVVADGLIESPVLGKIAPTQLSGGVKALLLIRNVPEKVFNASACGDNCSWWILRMAAKRDVTINLHHLMNFGRGKFTIKVLNSGNIVHDMAALIPEAHEALIGGLR